MRPPKSESGANRDALIKALLENKDEYTSGEELGELIGSSRAAVWKHIKALETFGIIVDSVRNKGYRISSETDTVHPAFAKVDEIAKMGFKYNYLASVGSTNQAARELANGGAPSGTLVVSEVQNTGKGRLSRGWESPQGGLWMSLVLRPEIPPSSAPFMTILTGVALADVLNKEYKVPAKIKWPNDILVDGRKLSGTLTEMDAEMTRINFIIIGMGINVNNSLDDLPKEVKAISLSQAVGQQTGAVAQQSGSTGEKLDRVLLLHRILGSIMSWSKVMKSEEGREFILDRWRELSDTLGKEVRVEMVGEDLVGKAVDILPSGALVVENEKGRHEVLSGDCIHLR